MKLDDCNKGDFVWVQIKMGDTLNSILQQYSTNVNNIIRNNPNIDLYEGEIVKIMNKTGNYHIVKPLETLHTIAQKYGTTIEELIKLNNLNSKRLFIGQSLKINQF